MQDSIYQPGYEPFWELSSPYVIQISKANFVKDTFYIMNAGNYGVNKTAVLSGKSFVFIANDEAVDYIYNGSGSFEKDEISYSMKTFVPGPNPNLYGKGRIN